MFIYFEVIMNTIWPNIVNLLNAQINEQSITIKQNNLITDGNANITIISSQFVYKYKIIY